MQIAFLTVCWSAVPWVCQEVQLYGLSRGQLYGPISIWSIWSCHTEIGFATLPKKKKSSQSIWIFELFLFNATILVSALVQARKLHGSVLSLVNTDCAEKDFCLLEFYTSVVTPVLRGWGNMLIHYLSFPAPQLR